METNNEMQWTAAQDAYLAKCESDATQSAILSAMRYLASLGLTVESATADLQAAYEALVSKAAAATSFHANDKLARMARVIRQGFGLAAHAVGQPGLRGSDGK